MNARVLVAFSIYSTCRLYVYVDLYKIDIPVHVDLLDLYSPSPMISISILGLRSQNAYMERQNLRSHLSICLFDDDVAIPSSKNKV